MSGEGMLADFLSHVRDPNAWMGPEGLVARIVEHLQYTGAALGTATALALPLGLYIGHTNRGASLVTTLANAARALPVLGLLLLAVLATSIGFGPVLLVLVVLGVPPILSSTYAGIRNVDPSVTDAARGIGLAEWAVLLRIEIPIALPLIFSGIRAATLQVISTATIAAVVALGGLGRPLLDSIALRDYPQAITAALLVALLAIGLDLLLAVTSRLVASPGLTGGPTNRTTA